MRNEMQKDTALNSNVNKSTLTKTLVVAVAYLQKVGQSLCFIFSCLFAHEPVCQPKLVMIFSNFSVFLNCSLETESPNGSKKKY